MDKILFNKMEFWGYHGAFKEENKLGQRFYVDLELYFDLSKAGRSDNLEDTVNYADIYKTVQQIVEKEKYELVEAIAERLATKILDGYMIIDEVLVRVTKPDPPIPGHYESVAIEIRRSRAGHNA
ncbi:dihydroneopterin aldolase [Aneurinibacillus aneurinilyticus]|jgi:dihydroneopterin aldolase|uniref:7,8-dihydroneopterin aldolase n=2 Tax=Aneurinibacillus aneurinilyticus TaxID=1391 RepID=A0A848CYB3_ANEAE|nr:dihydroneopterin aldolase [Aneurinibacillus aneurinilyticus]ERI08740.1 dihydroneopterin aldolase [Aneurinibacillus aneurinilyticus ATCC 12856]MCI1695308.1 dihydroneopterin aldolase [Aneurinibacillus aneurinilyticus]MED0671566.1 dihydroneopterin aldolase [Aneurinibacillus aneurinilyticus]MED0706858.1 dihydroneopterin aldolase [Aneurinibacillus aneurinilyticus]MED0723361.1 dihydroneopterin aldolase [Aneurinibacillus aneurinilyticus]